jgi:MORN repeat
MSGIEEEKDLVGLGVSLPVHIKKLLKSVAKFQQLGVPITLLTPKMDRITGYFTSPTNSSVLSSPAVGVRTSNQFSPGSGIVASPSWDSYGSRSSSHDSQDQQGTPSTTAAGNSSSLVGLSPTFNASQFTPTRVASVGGDGIYTGETNKDGKNHGRGEYRWNNGEVYSGMWSDDQRHGHGQHTFPSGETYVGEYENDERSGMGIYQWPDGKRDTCDVKTNVSVINNRYNHVCNIFLLI